MNVPCWSLVPENLVQEYALFPLEVHEGKIIIACSRPLSPEALASLHFCLGCSIEQRLLSSETTTSETTKDFLEKNCSLKTSMQLEVMMENSSSPFCFMSNEDPLEKKQEQEDPIVLHLKMLLDEAIEENASDIHLESSAKDCRLRYRIDGFLVEKKSIPLPLAGPLLSRLKLLAHLDITECRLSQDGRLTHSWKNYTVDFRLSSLPTQFGESLVLRLLDRRKMIRSLGSLELSAQLERSLGYLLKKPHGLLLVTGPIGAGKTTTLYACLQELQEYKLKIITAEDPVEYEIEGMLQVPIEESIGRTFERMIRSFLRHDPDVIMIGETRDEETARRAMEASLTGHLVLTTLHTSDAPEAISRLMNMGLDPFLITTTLEGVLAQRLVRKICSCCSRAYSCDEYSKEEITFFHDDPLPKQLYTGSGCKRCHGTGYYGRVAMMELLLPSDQLRLLIHQRASSHQLREQAHREGMISLQAEAKRYVIEGITTVAEIRRVL